ncbi:sulfotransferase [Congregibacter brevis]|uniref:Sulfotransferase n=1 Tax=Congregibacter brevis TaxID=3081201 RepID=A0ABZ0IEQ7_9GAMM|nr:sulfotransferase [Congregibacter sp. IMCC45268]
MNHTYLFILSPPYSGSTVLWQLLKTSSQVSALPDEGQKLPELRNMMRDNPWDPSTTFDWDLISTTWHHYWDSEKPVLLEKSPPHLCRVDAILERFQPTEFILLMRDPLAICEALHRRNGMSWEAAAERWTYWLGLHLKTREEQSSSQVLYYEDMVADPQFVFKTLAEWLPSLQDVDYTSAIEAHAVDGVQKRPLLDMNPRKITQIKPADRLRVLKTLEKSLSLIEETPYAAQYF